MNDIMDLHTHTTASGHASNTLYEMARSASKKGLTLFGSTDHAPTMAGTCQESYFISLKAIPRTLFGVKTLMGAELNILDNTGRIDLRESILEQLDYAIASLHDPCYKPGSIADNTNACLGAIRNPYVKIIGHPDDGRFPLDYDAVTAAAAEHHTLLEVNNSSLNPLSVRQNARENYLNMLKLCERYKTCIIIDSDAHKESDVGNHALAWELIKESGFPEELIVNGSLDRLLPFIPKLKEYL